MTSTVYFMNARSASLETGLVPKLLAVFDAAGFDKLIKPKDVVAIKTHCGEWNNTGYLRPVYARALADRVKSLGGVVYQPTAQANQTMQNLNPALVGGRTDQFGPTGPWGSTDLAVHTALQRPVLFPQNT